MAVAASWAVVVSASLAPTTREASTVTEKRRLAFSPTPAQACNTLAVCSGGRAAACSASPQALRLASTFRARSATTGLGHSAQRSRYQLRSSASIGPRGAVNRHRLLSTFR